MAGFRPPDDGDKGRGVNDEVVISAPLSRFQGRKRGVNIELPKCSITSLDDWNVTLERARQDREREFYKRQREILQNMRREGYKFILFFVAPAFFGGMVLGSLIMAIWKASCQ